MDSSTSINSAVNQIGKMQDLFRFLEDLDPQEKPGIDLNGDLFVSGEKVKKIWGLNKLVEGVSRSWYGDGIQKTTDYFKFYPKKIERLENSLKEFIQINIKSPELIKQIKDLILKLRNTLKEAPKGIKSLMETYKEKEKTEKNELKNSIEESIKKASLFCENILDYGSVYILQKNVYSLPSTSKWCRYAPTWEFPGKNDLFDLNTDRLLEQNPSFQLLNLSTPLVVKKGSIGTNFKKQFEIRSRLDHETLLKFHALYIRRGSDIQRLVMEKIKAKPITEFYHGEKLENSIIVNLLHSLKSCCLHLFNQKVCWDDMHNDHIFIESQTNALKFMHFGAWYKEENNLELSWKLFLTSVEMVGWILKSSKLRLNDKNTVYPFIFPAPYFQNPNFIQIFSHQGDFYKTSPEMKDLYDKFETNKDNEDYLKNHLTDYFDLVISKFKVWASENQNNL